MDKWLVEVKVWGRYACFTRPETKVERVSYPIITPSAAKGILEAIYWKPEFVWQVIEIWIMRHPNMPIEQVAYENFMPITLNELSLEGSSHPYEYNIAKHRVQRSCLIMRWPCFLIRAAAHVISKGTNPYAIKRQFDDRVHNGQCFYQPYLGLRQFMAYFGPRDTTDRPCNVTTNLGLVTYSAVHPQGEESVSYKFVDCKLEDGRLIVQSPEKFNDYE